MTVRELIAKLSAAELLDWSVSGTGAGSLFVRSPDDTKFAYVQTDDRPVKIQRNIKYRVDKDEA